MKSFIAVAIMAVVGLPLQADDLVQFFKKDREINVLIKGKVVTSYRYGDDHPKPFLYPVNTPSGVMVCRTFPPDKAKGESDDHPHHAGIFFAYDQVNGNNFWLNVSKSPRIEHIQTTAIEGGIGKGRLAALAHWIAKNGIVLLEEKRDMTFRPGKDQYAIDFKIDLEAREKVVFGDTKEGLFAIRVADWMREDFQPQKGVITTSGTGNGKYLNSAGDETEKNVWAKRAKWVSLQAEKDGKTVGAAIFDHPSSVNHPTYWHARGYGLFSANPLGQGVFEAARNPGKAQPLKLTLQPGEKAHFQYRILIHDGRRTKEQLEEEYKKFVN